MEVLWTLVLLFFTFGCKEVFCRSPPWASRSSGSCQCRIVGGDPVSIEEVPYQVQLLSPKGHFFCGGSIINARTIVSAGHCLSRLKPVKVATSTSVIGEGNVYESESVHLHPDYNGRTLDYDVAVINLAKPIDLDGVKAKAVKLAPSGSEIEPGTTILVSGWGATSEGGSGSENLLAVKVKALSKEDCSKAYDGHYNITAAMLCAADEGKDSCQGDSGGPAVSLATGELAGIVSWGIGCAQPKFPGVYTKISNPSIQDFINKHTVN